MSDIGPSWPSCIRKIFATIILLSGAMPKNSFCTIFCRQQSSGPGLKQCVSIWILFSLQFSDNKIDNWKDLEELVPIKSLETVYLERNPIYYDHENRPKADPNYRRKIKLTLPWIKQIDATLAQ